MASASHPIEKIRTIAGALVCLDALALVLMLALACDRPVPPLSTAEATQTATPVTGGDQTLDLALTPSSIEEANQEAVTTPPPSPTTEAARLEPTQTPATSSSDEVVMLGQKVFVVGTSPACASCHTIEGLPDADGAIGPALTHIAIVATTRKPPLSAREYIQESVENPDALLVPGFPSDLMPSDLRPQMSDEEFRALIDYLITLR